MEEYVKCPSGTDSGYLDGIAAQFYLINITTGGVPTSNFVTSGTKSVADGAWHHLEMSSGAAGSFIFVDGVSSGTGATTSANIGSAVWTPGAFGGTSSACEIDNAAIWSTQRHTAAFTPPTDYTGSEGMLALYRFNSASDTGNIVSNPGAETTPDYGVTGPTSGVSGVASSAFTVAARSTLAASTTITIAETDGSTSPTTVILAAGSGATGSFTYTPASTGAKTLSFTNSAGLNDAAALPYASDQLILPSSTAFHFSPRNWQCLTTGGGTRACAIRRDAAANQHDRGLLLHRLGNGGKSDS